MTTRARDFKFAGAIVQRLQLVMVALTQKFFRCIMHGFLVDGHISVWYYDLFDYCGLVPIQYLDTRAVSLVDKLNGESVLFVIPCVE